MNEVSKLSREELLALIKEYAKLWLAHDGLWFQAVERRWGMPAALTADTDAWSTFSVLEARRIMRFLGIEPGGGLEALKRALSYRMYALINEQEIIEEGEGRFVFRMRECRVQAARKRKGLPDHPCKQVGFVEYSQFARTIDERIVTRCVCCPPDAHPEGYVCAWEFSLSEKENDREG